MSEVEGKRHCVVEVDRGRAAVIVGYSEIEAILEQENKGTSSSSMHPAISLRAARIDQQRSMYNTCRVASFVVSPVCPCLFVLHMSASAYMCAIELN